MPSQPDLPEEGRQNEVVSASEARTPLRGLTPRERWGTCCPNDPNCDHSFMDDAELTRHMDTPMGDIGEERGGAHGYA